MSRECGTVDLGPGSIRSVEGTEKSSVGDAVDMPNMVLYLLAGTHKLTKEAAWLKKWNIVIRNQPV